MSANASPSTALKAVYTAARSSRPTRRSGSIIAGAEGMREVLILAAGTEPLLLSLGPTETCSL